MYRYPTGTRRGGWGTGFGWWIRRVGLGGAVSVKWSWSASSFSKRLFWSKVMAKLCIGGDPKLTRGNAGWISTTGWVKVYFPIVTSEASFAALILKCVVMVWPVAKTTTHFKIK